MDWWLLLILWLGGWLVIILLNVLNRAVSGTDYVIENIENELVKDGNNLFATGLVYFLGNLLCLFADLSVLHWILFVVGVAFCALPVLSLIPMAFDTFRMFKRYWLSFFGAVVCDVIPLVMALNIYFMYIR